MFLILPVSLGKYFSALSIICVIVKGVCIIIKIPPIMKAFSIHAVFLCGQLYKIFVMFMKIPLLEQNFIRNAIIKGKLKLFKGKTSPSLR